MNRFLLGLAISAIAIPGAYAQDEFDDIYYNPKSKKESNKDSEANSNYIADFSSIDVDEYNRRGFYYESAVDTIGQAVENAEDFVYTQQIQKYYNPTIVVDNSDVLSDILENSYGNVEIVIDNGYPAFTSIYTGSYGWAPSYYNWCLRPAWTWSYAWGPFDWAWTWGPAWSWGYPSWSYYPSWGWGYGPGWGPRPPRPLYGFHHPSRPGATRPGAPNPGWSHNTRPGGNYNGGTSYGRPGSRPMARPASSSSGGNMQRPVVGRRNQTAVSAGAMTGGSLKNNTGTVRSSARSTQKASVNGAIGSGNRINNTQTSVQNGKTTGTAKVQNQTARQNTVKANTGTVNSNQTVKREATNRTATTNRATTTTTNRSSATTNRSVTNQSTTNRSYNTSGNRNFSTGSSRSSGSVSRGSAGGGASRSGGGARGGRR